MELIDLSLIKPMLIRSLENPEAIKNFINYVIFGGFSIPIGIIIIIIIVSIIFKTFRDVTKGLNTKEEKDKRKVGFWKSLFNNVKFYVKKYQDFCIGLLLLSLSRMFVSLIFRSISSWTTGIDIHINSFSNEELILLGARSLYSLLFFLIAPIFIMFSFGNNFVRNIGIFIYILGIFFVPLGRFLQLGYSGANYSTEATPNQNIDYNYYEISNNAKFSDNTEVPDSAEIIVDHTKIIEGEAVNLSVTIKKDGKKMDNYNGTILIIITDENGAILKNNEYTLPNFGVYSFLPSDFGEKEFQKGLTINKEGSFYIEVSDLNDFEDKVLGRQKITVIKKS